jgi:hypothetical protein
VNLSGALETHMGGPSSLIDGAVDSAAER